MFTFSWGLSSNALICSLSSHWDINASPFLVMATFALKQGNPLHQVQIVSPSLRINLHLQGGCLSPFLARNFYNTFSFFHLQCLAEGTGSIASSLTSISLVLSNNFSQQVSNALSASKCCWILTIKVDCVASSWTLQLKHLFLQDKRKGLWEGKVANLLFCWLHSFVCMR